MPPVAGGGGGGGGDTALSVDEVLADEDIKGPPDVADVRAGAGEDFCALVAGGGAG